MGKLLAASFGTMAGPESPPPQHPRLGPQIEISFGRVAAVAFQAFRRQDWLHLLLKIWRLHSERARAAQIEPDQGYPRNSHVGHSSCCQRRCPPRKLGPQRTIAFLQGFG